MLKQWFRVDVTFEQEEKIKLVQPILSRMKYSAGIFQINFDSASKTT